MNTRSGLLIFSPEITPRVEFAFEFVFRTILGVTISFTTKRDEFIQSGLPKINYSEANFTSGLFMKAHPVLSEKSVIPHEITEVEFAGNRLFFPSSGDSFLPFDPFACTFYLITRYEEYLPFRPDKYQRFPDSENLLVKNNLHLRPVVDQWAYLIAGEIAKRHPDFKVKDRTFSFLTTIDIDNAWAYQNKGLLVTSGGVVKAILSGRFSELKQRLDVIRGIHQDPYDTYDYVLDVYREHFSKLCFFFLLGDRGKFDHAVSYLNKNFRTLIARLSSLCEVGVHPSYASNENDAKPELEKKRLEHIIQKKVSRSRQHYLKLKFPDTCQTLIKNGITDDFTMGFASQAGFRAGTCTPFPFFDLSKNQRTELIIHPFQMMDVSLKNYLQLSPDYAIQLIEELMLEVRKVNGTFVSVWHNESLGDMGQWKGWRKVFEQIVTTGINYENE